MLKVFGFGRSGDKAVALPSAGEFGRIYAIGDVHGKYDLLSDLLRSIANDLQNWRGRPFQIVFLGDLIDRGDKSRQVLEIAGKLARASERVRFIKGNHEEVFLRAYEGDHRACEFFYQIGGRETLMSYGLECEPDEDIGAASLALWMQDHIPCEHVDLIDTFQDMILIGDYIFVHAGIRPKTALEKQSGADLRWIREKFLDYNGSHPGMVIHGHSITDDVDERPNRIGIDTGAYRTGKLTAIVLEGQTRRFLTAVEGECERYLAEEDVLLLLREVFEAASG